MTDEEEPMSSVEKVQKSLHDMFMGNKKSSVTFKDDGLSKLETVQENFQNMILNETNSMKNYEKNYSEIDKINSPNGNSKIERPTLSKSEIQSTIDEESDELKKTQGLIYELMMGRSASRRISRDTQNKIVFLIRSEIDRRKLPMERPVKLTDLESELRRLYGVPLNIFHSNDSYDYLQKINSQNELDNLIRLHDMRNPNSKFRLTVSPIDEEDRILKPDPSGVFRTSDFISDTTSDAATSANTILSSGDFNLAALANLPEIPERCPPEAYREGTKIGTGAHGSVYVCYDYETGEKLVVKKIFARGDANAIKQKMDSLRDSVGLLSRLSHENIVEYRGAVIADNFVLIFMEFMTGGSLYEVIREAGVLPPRQTIDTTRQILCGLEYLHNLGIVHRDIKSANIMRTAQMPVVVKIGDFGSAQFLRALASFSLTDYKGTPHYTAPEIFKRRKPYDEKADIYSVGITIIEMLTTRTPYADIEPAVLFYKIADDKNIEYDLPKETPKNLQNIIEKMLVREPTKRPTANQLLDLEIFKKRQ